MKRIGLFLFAAVMVFGAVGCGEDEATVVSNDPPNPDVVVPYSAPSAAIAFEDVSAVFDGAGKTNTVEIAGFVRNTGSLTREFIVKANFKQGDIAIADDKDATLTATSLDPGMRTKFVISLLAAGYTSGTVTYWGVDGTAMTQKFTIEL